MDIYANTLTEEALRREYYYAFSDTKYPGVPQLNLNTIDEQLFYIGDIPVIPIVVWHLKMPVYGFRFGDFTYITDANRIDADELAKVRGSKLMVVNALRREPHLSHFTLSEAVTLVQDLGVPEAYFTHISHQLGKYTDLRQELTAGNHLAYDGLQLHV